MSSPSSDIRADDALRVACAEAIEELRAARRLIRSQDALIVSQGGLVELERQISDGLKRIRTLDAEEKELLSSAVAAARREVDAIRGANEALKRNQATFWKRLKWVVVGGAVGVIAGSVLVRR
ncbi:MAG: hypothetical protein IPM50_02685 [Acidobacteriota bacterium]|nr:MAG: hypothetical protein IPM50_02685 [Acidobacteriota bacterium]